MVDVKVVDRAIEFGESYAIDRRFLLPDGSIRWLHELGYAKRGSDGVITHLIGTIQDVTERKVAEQQIQVLNRQLVQAYDATLEGWSQALDLRDKETEGHSLRVTEMAVRLAQALGIQGEDLVNIRRGSLLHDIGKLGVPDRILLKPGPLNDDEWEVMRKHPTYASEWLRVIPFLAPALAIPDCHHERWDGKGYPHGLKGEEIPLAARIFAVADTWDAICSDRPYRKGRAEHEALAIIEEQAGRQFDPKVVEVFLKLRRFQPDTQKCIPSGEEHNLESVKSR